MQRLRSFCRYLLPYAQMSPEEQRVVDHRFGKGPFEVTQSNPQIILVVLMCLLSGYLEGFSSK